MIVTSNRGFAEWGEVFGDPRRNRTSRSPASPCGRRPDRRIELSAPPARRAHARTLAIKSLHHIADIKFTIATARPATEKWTPPPGQPERRNWGILLRHFWGRVALTGDAQGIAQIVRTRWFKAVHLKSATGQRPRTLTAARNTVRAALPTSRSSDACCVPWG